MFSLAFRLMNGISVNLPKKLVRLVKRQSVFRYAYSALFYLFLFGEW